MSARVRAAGRLRWRAIGPLVFVVFGLAAVTPARASTVRLSVASRVIPTATAVRVEIDLANGGDDPARQVVPSVEFQARVVAADAIDAVAPSTATTVTLDIPMSGATPPRGRWPVLIRVAYGDGAGGVYEAIHVDTAVFGPAQEPSSLRLRLPDVSLETERDLDLRVDRGGVATPVRLAFATPAGITTSPATVMLDPQAATTVRVRVTNSSLPPESRVPIVAIAEYDVPSGHHTVTAIAMLDIRLGAGDSRIVVTSALLAATVMIWLALAGVTAWRRRRQQS